MTTKFKLRVGVTRDDPEVVGCFMNLPARKCKTPGFDIEVFDNIMKLLNWDYELKLSGKFDYGYQRSDGSWSGLVGMAQRNEIDCTASRMRVTPARLEAVDFSFPVNYAQQIFLIGRPEKYDFHAFMLKPFATKVWLLAVLGLILVAVFRSLFLIFHEKHSIKFVHRSFVKQSLWDTFAITTKQKFTYHGLGSVTISAMLYVLSVGFLAVYYVCWMQSLLSVPLRTKMPFLDILELTKLVEERSWKFAYVSPGPQPKSPLKNLVRLQKALKQNPIRILNPKPLQKSLDTENSAFFAIQDVDLIPDRISVYSKTLLQIRDDANLYQWVSFAFRKNLTSVRQKFDQALIEFMPFLRDRLKWKYYLVYPPAMDKNDHELVKISLAHLMEAFILWLCGVVPAVFVFTCEVMGRYFLVK